MAACQYPERAADQRPRRMDHSIPLA